MIAAARRGLITFLICIIAALIEMHLADGLFAMGMLPIPIHKICHESSFAEGINILNSSEDVDVEIPSIESFPFSVAYWRRILDSAEYLSAGAKNKIVFVSSVD